VNLITAQPGIIATIYLSPIALLKIIKNTLASRTLQSGLVDKLLVGFLRLHAIVSINYIN
jgi:hypothetical protein